METKKDEEVNEEKVVVAIETKTPVPLETAESPQAVTPVPEHVEEIQGNICSIINYMISSYFS